MEQEFYLRTYWLLIRRWLWLIALSAILLGAVAFAASTFLIEPLYSAQTRILVQPSSSITGIAYQDILAGEQVADTYAQLLQSRTILALAYERLGRTGGEHPRYKVQVQRVSGTGILELSVESTAPQLAADMANSIVTVFIEENRQRQAARFAAAKEVVQEQISGLEDDVIRLEELMNQQQTEEELSRLEVQRALLQVTLATLAGNYYNMELAELQAVDLISMVEPAEVPSTPVRPRILTNTLMAAAAGAILGAGVAFLIERLDTSVRSVEQAKESTASTLLGSIWYEPALARIPAKRSADPLRNVFSPGAEAFRTLVLNLRFAAVDRPLRTLLVTSPLAQEGKSFVTTNLGIALAQTGKAVIVIDADLRYPNLERFTGVPLTPGLSNALSDGAASPSSYLRPVEGVPNLQVLPAGQLVPNPHEVLASQRMSKLLEELSAQAELVLLDSPPTLAVADAAVLADKVDGVLLVLDLGRTDRNAAAAAAEQLRRSGSQLVGVVLNKVPLNGQARGSHYFPGSQQKRASPAFFWRQLKRWLRLERRRPRTTVQERLDEAMEQLDYVDKEILLKVARTLVSSREGPAQEEGEEP